MTTHELISYCFYEDYSAPKAQEFIKRCYSLDIPLTKISAEYNKLAIMAGRKA